ncbi:hypothetical protein V8C37DRAFT_409391 [Trichoderma ceciliae]
MPDFVSPRDNNVYTLGRMGRHNVVIAALPDGEYGTVAASAVARDMLHSFPNVRIGLMVGIGGGVPSERHDIRLGDVVVSATRNREGGVFQYDFGKTIQAQEFQNTIVLDQPPMLLRSAVCSLMALYESDGHQFQEAIDGILVKKPKLRKKYQRPHPSTDRLYYSNIVHPSTSASDEHCAETCGDDQSILVSRGQRAEDEDDPAVHYGLIASGNQLMKDAWIRDQLAWQKYVLCFEMEAAGLMNHFPCLVIRGICDYSDSHKNQDWQGYAAMTAAAYAKDLVKHIPPNKIEAEARIIDALSGVKESVDRLVRMHHDQNTITVLDWLTTVEYGAQQSDHLRRRQQGTGKWLLDSEQFRDWLRDENQTLFCPGMPGAGKTVLTSIVVDELHSKFQDNPEIGIAYIYVNYKLQDEQTIDALLVSLLKQLAASRPSLPSAVQDLYNRHNSNKTRPFTDELTHALQSLATTCSRVFILIDALDEWQSSNDSRWKVLSSIFSLQSKTRANLFGTPALEIRANEEDAERYLRGNLPQFPGFVRNNPSLHENIVTSILQAVQGMFLLAQLHLDSLKGKTKPKEVTVALQRLATGSDAYEQAQLALSALLWITYAKRPLTIVELQHALGVEPGESAFDEQNLPDIELLVSVCAGLVTIDNDSNIIRLVHYTTQEYLQQTHEKWFPEPQSEITTTCITYLSYEVFRSVPCHSYWAFEARFGLYPFYNYAFNYWGHHAREGSVMSHEVMEHIKHTGKIESSCQAWEVMDWEMNPYYDQSFLRQMRGIHLAAWFGLVEAVDQLLLNKDASIDAVTTNSINVTPLHVAAWNNHEAVVQLLLDKGANIEAIDSGGNRPLFIAAWKNHKAVIPLLLDRGASVNSLGVFPGSPLRKAAINGNEAIVRLLLDRGANIEAADDNGRTPLFIAAWHNHEAVVQLLLDKGANTEATSRSQRTPLHIAAKNGNEAITRLLLDKGANVEAIDDGGRTPLSLATENNHEAIVQLLLNKGSAYEIVKRRSL